MKNLIEMLYSCIARCIATYVWFQTLARHNYVLRLVINASNQLVKRNKTLCYIIRLLDNIMAAASYLSLQT